MQIWRARPSGHSDYFTIVGIFDSSENAKKAQRVLREALQEKDRWTEEDWDQEEASLELTGAHLKFSVYTAGYLEQVFEILKSQNPKEMREYRNAQELDVSFEFDSTEARLQDIIILLLLKHPFLQELVRDSKARVENTKDGRKTLCTFHYYGDWIYDSGESELLGHSESELGCNVTVLDE